MTHPLEYPNNRYQAVTQLVTRWLTIYSTQTIITKQSPNLSQDDSPFRVPKQSLPSSHPSCHKMTHPLKYPINHYQATKQSPNLSQDDPAFRVPKQSSPRSHGPQPMQHHCYQQCHTALLKMDYTVKPLPIVPVKVIFLWVSFISSSPKITHMNSVWWYQIQSLFSTV